MRCYNIDILGEPNKTDVVTYIEKRLHLIAEDEKLSPDWPGSEAILALSNKAGGLFIWASVVCAYLRTASFRDKKIQALISTEGSSLMSIEAKMDNLYATVLETCDWNDEDFVNAYQLVMGAIMASRTALSSAALQYLHEDYPNVFTEVLPRVNSLLMARYSPDEPINTLHLSLREFLTQRAHSAPLSQRYSINLKIHNERMAILCIQTIVRDLNNDNIPGLDYDVNQVYEQIGIPYLPVSEGLSYACRFWMRHLLDVEEPSSDLLKILPTFINEFFVPSLKVIVMDGSPDGVSKVWGWLKVSTQLCRSMS